MKKIQKTARIHKASLRPTQTIALVFAGLILLGTVLLALPIASRTGKSCGLLPALFTATSATCVTGLVLFDTWTQFSGFGQGVLLALIEIGGLGFMSAASLVVFLLRKKVGMRQRMVMAQALSVDDMENVVRLQKWVLFGSLGIQLTGALLLFLRFFPEYDFHRAAAWAVFHAVSAFCNAGFDIVGSVAPGQSMMVFYNDPVVLITLMALVVIGGLGFFVWDEVVHLRRFKKFSVYTKLVLLTTGILIIAGAAAFALLEWNNSETIGSMTIPEKILNCFFQSVTLRTAGFTSINQAGLTEAGKAISVVLMLIGGSSGSTAGGLKTVTLVVLLLFLRSRMRSQNAVNVFHRQIHPNKVLDAMTLAALMIGLAFTGSIFISINSHVPILDALFETASALGTVGLTTGVTPLLGTSSKLLIILFMYFGRVGILTLSLGFLMGNQAEDRYRYAHTNLLIG